MNQLKKHILFFDFLENHYVSKDEVSKQHLNVIKKSNFVKEDKTIVRSSHPSLETVLITHQKTEVKASPFKIADDQTPIISIIEQNNFTNESLHVIGQQLDHIEEKIIEKTVSIENPVFEKSVSIKTEKPLIDLLSQREKVMFKTSQSKTLEVVEKMLSDLKVKTEGTSRSTACTISRNGKEIVSDENTDSANTVSSVSTKKIFDNDLPKIKRFFGNSKPMSFTKNWYAKPTPPDMQFEERVFQTQFSVSADKLYKWNIDGLSKQNIINKMSHMVGIAYQNNHDLDQPKIVNLLVTGFSGTLCRWWDSYLTDESRDSIKHAAKKNVEGFPILMKILVAVFLIKWIL